MHVQLVRAWPGHHEMAEVELAVGACVEDALAAAGWRCEPPFVRMAIFGQLVEGGSCLQEGDRIELLRPLMLDPKEARRRRAEARKRLT
jgi:putative ubiquitin-RnfH superfamily antitoxin RatB of RatAB toxin-antitoxin module